VLFEPARTPLTPGERQFLAAFCFLLFGGLIAEVVRDYEPVKLAIPLFFLGRGALTCLHEGGHALVARLVGWRVYRISVGMGPLLRRFRVGRTPVDLHLFPFGGFVLPAPVTLRRARLASTLIYAAGPGIEVLAVGALALAIGPEALFHRSAAVPVLAVQSVAAAAAMGVALNLWPRTLPNGGWTDGMGVLRSPFLTKRQLDQRLAVPELLAGHELLARGEAEAALGRFEAALERHPDVLALHVGAAQALVLLGRRTEALLSLQALLRRPDLSGPDRAYLESARAALRGHSHSQT
jgi:hypothetical protein